MSKFVKFLDKSLWKNKKYSEKYNAKAMIKYFDIYKNDKKFLLDMLEGYINCTEDKIKDKLNVIAKYVSLVDPRFKYSKYLNDFYKDYKIQINIFIEIEEEKSRNNVYNWGKGFLLIQKDNAGKTYLINYLAEKMLEEIIFDTYINLEEWVFDNCNKKYIMENSFFKIICDFVGLKDRALQKYIYINPHLIDKYKSLIDNYQNNYEEVAMLKENNKKRAFESAYLDYFDLDELNISKEYLNKLYHYKYDNQFERINDINIYKFLKEMNNDKANKKIKILRKMEEKRGK